MIRHPKHFVAGCLMAAVLLFALFHHIVTWSTHNASFVMAVAVGSFAWLILQLYLAHSHRDITVPENVISEVDLYDVRIVVPLFNEDPETFRQLLESIRDQSRPVDFTYIVDDGSHIDGIRNDACERVFNDFIRSNPSMKSKMSYTVTPNGGKREAQAIAFRQDTTSDVTFTIDSDTVLERDAIRNGVMAFIDPKVMSIGGLLHGLNAYDNLLTRLTNIGFVLSFLNGRSSWSRLGSVAVQCGGLAAYRSWVIRKYLDEYLNQEVFGHKRLSGDDRIMTNFALLEGKSVFQESCVGYTLLPSNITHLTNQRVRWWRSFFWGGLWLLGRFPMNRIVWWLVAWQFVAFAMYTVVLPISLIIHPTLYGYLPVLFLAYIAFLSYARAARYLTVQRPDETSRQQFITVLLAPVSCFLHLYLCSVLQYVGLFTVNKGAWSTRKKVEVGIQRTDTTVKVPASPSVQPLEVSG